jgi:hypothetical protein
MLDYVDIQMKIKRKEARKEKYHINYIILLSKDNNMLYHIIYMIKYYPYKSDKPNIKYHIITNDNKKSLL